MITYRENTSVRGKNLFAWNLEMRKREKRCNLSNDFVCIEEEDQEAAIPTCPAIILSPLYLDPLPYTHAALIQNTVRCPCCPSLSVCVPLPPSPYLPLTSLHRESRLLQYPVVTSPYTPRPRPRLPRHKPNTSPPRTALPLTENH